MFDQQILFVADTAFVDSETVKQRNLLSVFPRKAGDGAYRDNLDNLLQRSKLQSAYYDTLLPKLIPLFETYMPAAGSELSHFVRPVLVTVTSLFVDRCVCLLHRIRQQKSKNIAVVEVKTICNVQWLGEIKNTSSASWHLNQEIIQRIMLALGFDSVPVFDHENYPEYPDTYTVPNLLFSPQQTGLYWLRDKIMNRYYALLRHMPNIKAKIISFGFVYDEFYAAKRGLYGPFGLLRRSYREIQLEPSLKNEKLRDDLFVAIESTVKPQIEALLSHIDPYIQAHEISPIGDAYIHMLTDWFPIGFLEGLSFNLEKTKASSGKATVVSIIGSELTSDRGYFECASARMAGKFVIGVQHGGGHYGYIEDFSIVGQFECALYDRMITWGWTDIDPHLPQCKTIPLPCPKFSERPLKANYLESGKRSSISVRDVLFLSNLFHRFPHASTCGQARVDFIDEITNSQEELMKAINDAGITINHKPYGMEFVDLYPEHYRRLEVAGGNGYSLLKSTHKGLTVALIKTCRIVLWDQIGSGTLECFTSDVPTIVYWKRIYSREAPWARELIAELERCGVVHTDADELSQEIKTYLANPEGWMNNKERKRAIQTFCHKFALTDSLWYETWKRQLLQWSAT